MLLLMRLRAGITSSCVLDGVSQHFLLRGARGEVFSAL